MWGARGRKRRDHLSSSPNHNEYEMDFQIVKRERKKRRKKIENCVRHGEPGFKFSPLNPLHSEFAKMVKFGKLCNTALCLASASGEEEMHPFLKCRRSSCIIPCDE